MMPDGDIDTADLFIDLFEGRTDAYGHWDGGMVPNTDTQYCPYVPMSDHLFDGPFVGVYPVTDDNTTGWGCIDIDGKGHTYTRHFHNDRDETEVSWDEMWEIAAELQDVLAYKQVTSWLERTAHGIHVWVFAEQRLPAATMRHALLVACDVAEYKPKEVNPKQVSVSADKPLGNYVRCPYPGALSKGTPDSRFVIDEDGRPLTVQQFCRTAMGSRVPVTTLEAMSALYVEPETRSTNVDLDAANDTEFAMLRPILPVVVEMMFTDGAIGDRSATLVRAAAILKDDGWLAQAAFCVLRALDRLVLRKFADRPDPDGPLLKIIETVGL